ncbi:UNVERIFIED_CONTAM: hypothetical protein Sradi_0189200 [Sesamum radiatum]|uniref:DUF8040 domain-containing protein n=1 Tax=Sesamum radiatum TaxID=300843 RepID=A0AAW2W0D2_SESRA
MRRLVEFSDIACIENLRMSRNAFAKLCLLLQTQGGLEDSRHVPLSSQVAMFLSMLAHHKKNRTVKYDFIRSGRTVSKHFHCVLNVVLRLHPLLLARHTPVPPNSTCPRWKWFEGCLGALDGTYIDVRVKAQDRARYRTRKGSIAVNALGVCDRDMHFIYVLAGWEEMSVDPLESMLNETISPSDAKNTEYIGTVETNSVWNCLRDEIARSMYNDWRGHS